ncbi:hypothetical protein Q8W15_02520 [Photobacterium damselae subsp. piscicida]|nr:hypothetical protein [Photobacterium damselae subsp. piscicida]MDP2556516.1 hypothetical protein [Photobacterium damselae subsp. piscicida]
MFIEKANEIHQNKYSYGHFIYSGALEKGIITCPEHGDFEQRADAHLRGVGCPQCAKNGRKKTTKQFIKEAQQVHGKLYDYSQFIYTNVRTKGIIICAQHGEFEQLPSNHLSGNGCPKCAAEKKARLDEVIVNQNITLHQFHYYDKFTQCPVYDWAIELRLKMTDL